MGSLFKHSFDLLLQSYQTKRVQPYFIYNFKSLLLEEMSVLVNSDPSTFGTSEVI